MRGAPDYCPMCGEQIVTARVMVAGLDVTLDPRPSESGPIWIDDEGRARSTAVSYMDGEPRYRPHTCPR